ncbi:MAG: hypothetical protein LUE27_10630 [Clostridia bacterium]|nr:hypothetical protein [Clostridia bacterium]
MSKVAEAIKAIIDREGLGYLDTNAYDVYTELLKNEATDEKSARMILITLLAGAHRQETLNASSLSSFIQTACCLTESAANEMAGIYAELLCENNRMEWENNSGKGFRKFCEFQWHFDLDGDAVWDSGHGYLKRSCSVSLDLEVCSQEALLKAIEPMLEKNPFTTEDAIRRFLDDEMQRRLNADFDDYCDVDDDKPPVIEDYSEYCRYWIDTFCAEYGLKIISYGFECEEDD